MKEMIVANRNCDLAHVTKELQYINKHFRSLILKMLALRVEERITVSDALLHPWITQANHYIPTEDESGFDLFL